MSSEVIYHTQTALYWDWRVAADLFLGGAGVGALLLAVGIDEWFNRKYRRICHTAAWLAPLLVGAGLMLLMLKMGRPLHTYKAYLNFNPHSPLWWGGIFQPILLLGAVVYALRWGGEVEDDPTRRWLGRVLVPIAIIVGAYHGLLLAINVSRPLWNTGPTVVAAMLAFVSTGIAAVMLVHLLRMKLAGRLADQDHVAQFLTDMKVVRNTLVAVLVLQLGTFFLWWLSLKYGSLDDQHALAAANASCGPMFWYLGIGMGLIVPLLLGGLVVLRGPLSMQRYQVSMIALTSLLILVGGFFFRLAVVLGGQADLPIHTLS